MMGWHWMNGLQEERQIKLNVSSSAWENKDSKSQENGNQETLNLKKLYQNKSILLKSSSKRFSQHEELLSFSQVVNSIWEADIQAGRMILSGTWEDILSSLISSDWSRMSWMACSTASATAECCSALQAEEMKYMSIHCSIEQYKKLLQKLWFSSELKEQAECSFSLLKLVLSFQSFSCRNLLLYSNEMVHWFSLRLNATEAEFLSCIRRDSLFLHSSELSFCKTLFISAMQFSDSAREWSNASSENLFLQAERRVSAWRRRERKSSSLIEQLVLKREGWFFCCSWKHLSDWLSDKREEELLVFLKFSLVSQ